MLEGLGSVLAVEWCTVITGYRVRPRLDCWADSVWEIMLLLSWKREAVSLGV